MCMLSAGKVPGVPAWCTGFCLLVEQKGICFLSSTLFLADETLFVFCVRVPVAGHSIDRNNRVRVPVVMLYAA